MGKLKQLEQEIREMQPKALGIPPDGEMLLEAAQTILGLRDIIDKLIEKRGEREVLGRSMMARMYHSRSGTVALALGATIKSMAKNEKVEVVDRCNKDWSRTFNSRRECLAWLNEGLAGTEGAEQEHYADMLVELNSGATILHYN